MDSIPSQITFSFAIDQESMRCEDFRESWQVYLRVVGDFEIHVNRKILYKETQFCLVEFAVQLYKWINRDNYPGEFVYTSMESDEEGLVWFKKEWDGWRIGSVHQEYCEEAVFKDEPLLNAASKYIENLKSELSKHYSISIDELLTGAVDI